MNNIPILLQYFFPGFFFILTFKYLTNIKPKSSTIFIMSVAISYFSICFLSLFILTDDALMIGGISCGGLIILSIILAKIYSSKMFINNMVRLFHRTQHTDIWHDVLDLNDGSSLKIYLKDKKYYVIGSFHCYEENGKESWFSISKYGKYDIESNNPIETTFHDKKDIFMVFNLMDVDHIEVFN